MFVRKHRSIHVDGVDHGKAPIPMGARVGNMIFSSGIPGKDPSTNSLPPDAESQARFAFENLRSMLVNAGSSLGDLGHLTVYVKEEAVREAVNVEWLRHFPDPGDRPARHTVVHDLRAGMLLQLEAIAVAGEE